MVPGQKYCDKIYWTKYVWQNIFSLNILDNIFCDKIFQFNIYSDKIFSDQIYSPNIYSIVEDLYLVHWATIDHDVEVHLKILNLMLLCYTLVQYAISLDL